LEGENATLGKMSQTQTLQWFLKKGKESDGHYGGMEAGEGIVPVRSCFNGFTLYRADVYFDPRCRYDLYNQKDALYMSRSELHTCEHIVFNECLGRVLAEKSVDGNFRIAVKPDLLTLWHLIN